MRTKSLAFGFLTILFTLPLNATTLEQWNTQQLTKASRWIQVGKVTSKWSAWGPQRKMIYTYVRLQVDQTLKGEKQEEVLIRVPGGQDGEYGMVVHGMANFKHGERALVFLRQDQDGAPSLVGMTQGKFRIYKNLATGEDMALFKAPKDLEFFTRSQSGRVRHVVSSQVERRVPLSNLIDEIRAHVRQEVPVSH